MRYNTRSTIIPARTPSLRTPRIPDRIKNTINTPRGAERRRRQWESQPRNEHSAESGRVVLAEVLVSALSGVEGEHGGFGGGSCGLDLFVRRVFEGVRDLGCFAEGAYAPAEPDADEEGGDGGANDIAKERGLAMGEARVDVLVVVWELGKKEG